MKASPLSTANALAGEEEKDKEKKSEKKEGTGKRRELEFNEPITLNCGLDCSGEDSARQRA